MFVYSTIDLVSPFWRCDDDGRWAHTTINRSTFQYANESTIKFYENDIFFFLLTNANRQRIYNVVISSYSMGSLLNKKK